MLLALIFVWDYCSVLGKHPLLCKRSGTCFSCTNREHLLLGKRPGKILTVTYGKRPGSFCTPAHQRALVSRHVPPNVATQRCGWQLAQSCINSIHNKHLNRGCRVTSLAFMFNERAATLTKHDTGVLASGDRDRVSITIMIVVEPTH